jgi:hypothetical protein
MNPLCNAVRIFVCPLALALAFSACDGAGEAAAAAGDIEQVVLAIGEIPENVSCLRITAAGAAREVVRHLEVVPGSAVSESFSGLPVGTVVFRAEAFAAACESVTKSSIPTWVSQDEPVTVSLTRSASVALVLHRNGRAKVSIAFVDEQGAPDSGSTPDGGATDR